MAKLVTEQMCPEAALGLDQVCAFFDANVRT